MSTIHRIASVTVAVRDQEEALRWFTQKLGFEKRTDAPGPNDMRFLSIGLPGQDLQLILAPWFPHLVGKNATMILHTSDCTKAYAELKAKGVEFREGPAQRPFGLQAIFRDLYGNEYALLQTARGR